MCYVDTNTFRNSSRFCYCWNCLTLINSVFKIPHHSSSNKSKWIVNDSLMFGSKLEKSKCIRKCTTIKCSQQIKKIRVRESGLRFRVNLARISKWRMHSAGQFSFGRGTSSKFVARSLIIERHGLRFNGWLMNAGRSSSNLVWRRGWNEGRKREEKEDDEEEKKERTVKRFQPERVHSENRFLIVERTMASNVFHTPGTWVRRFAISIRVS